MAKRIGFGTKLQWSTDNFGTVTNTVGNITSVEFSGATRDDVDQTDHENSNEYRTFLSGLADPGEITITAWMDTSDATQTDFIAKLNDGNEIDFRVVHPDGTTNIISGKGYVKGYQPSFPLDGMIGVTFTVKLSGDPTFCH